MSTTIRMQSRFPLMLLALFGLVMGAWAGLLRMGWALPNPSEALVAQHGPLMLSGFLGTLISLERAVALGRRWVYAAPLLAGIGGVLLVLGAPDMLSRGLIVVGSAVLVAMFALILRAQLTGAHLTMALGALLWLCGNVLWWLGWPVFRAVPWWLGFLVLTVAGERLELARVMRHGKRVLAAFALAVLLFAAGLVIGLFEPATGVSVSGVGLLALGAWLLRFDIARRTIRKTGLTRYIAACLLPGYVWLMLAGLLWLVYPSYFQAGLQYDAMLHAVLVGFVFSMIYGHVPIIVPALMRRDVRYAAAFYAPLALLHASLCMRIIGDLWPDGMWRMWGGLINEVAVLAFFTLVVSRVRA